MADKKEPQDESKRQESSNKNRKSERTADITRNLVKPIRYRSQRQPLTIKFPGSDVGWSLVQYCSAYAGTITLTLGLLLIVPCNGDTHV